MTQNIKVLDSYHQSETATAAINRGHEIEGAALSWAESAIFFESVSRPSSNAAGTEPTRTGYTML